MKKYNCINETGLVDYPSEIELKSLKSNGVLPIVVLDSCVCFDIIKFVENNKRLNEIDIEKVQSFLCYQKESKIDVLGSFGVLELSLQGKKFALDEEKFVDFGNLLMTGLKLSAEEIRLRQIGKIERQDWEIQHNHFSFLNLLKHSYVSLLKLRSLAQQELGGRFAIKMLEQYIDWQKNELDCILGLELHLAIHIFGGSDRLRKMIGLGKDKDFKRVLWGTAWDFLHYRLICQFSNIYEIQGIKHRTFFITKDNVLTHLLQETKLEAVFMDKKQYLRTMFTSSSELKHFKKSNESLMEMCNDLIKERGLSTDDIKLSLSDLEELIGKLEELNAA